MRIYVFFLVLAIVVPKINGSNINTQRKLEEATPDDLSNKCGGCPCNSPCVQVPPPSPPSPPPPSPPPLAPKPQASTALLLLHHLLVALGLLVLL
ncbi:hypothetical protein LIER_43426 [Lithospermum erythrorhizon]|uniref:Uncharacterized protein n=1 Tax=Lithospermum erythrorhizon TaxID=34254 RepID=A0AAV3Q2Y8_LITER